MNTAVIGIRADVKQALRGIDQLNAKLDGIQRSANRTAKSITSIETATTKMGNAFRSALGVIAGAGLFNLVNNLQSVDNVLRVATGSTEDLTYAQDEAFRIAQKYGVSLQATGELMGAVARNQSKLGYTIRETAQVTEAMSAALYASGTNAVQAGSVMTQFSQILAKGKVNGDEFTTIMENLGGPVLDTVAKNMGITTAELVEMKEKGLIDAKSFTDALIVSLDDLNAMTGKAMPTLGQSLQRVQNAFGKFLLELNKSTGIFDKLGASIEWASKNLRIVTAIASGFIGAFAAVKIAAIVGQIISLTRAIRTMGVAIAVAEAFATGGLSAITALAGAAAVAAGAYALFPDDLEEKLVVPTEDAAAATTTLNSELGKTPGQLKGITDKYEEIKQDLDDQLRLVKLTDSERKVESELLKYNEQLMGKMTDAQREHLKDQLTKIQNEERSKTLLKDQAQIIGSFADAYASSLDIAIRKSAELQEQLRLGLTNDEYQKLQQQRLLNDENYKRAALTNAESLITDEINAELSKYDSIYAIQTEYSNKQRDLSWMQIQHQLGVIKLTESQQKVLANALVRLEEDKNHEIWKLQDETVERERQRQKEIEDINLRRIKAVYAAEIKNSAALRQYDQKNVLQRQAASELQQQLVEERINFEKKSEIEKAQFVIQQGADMYSALGAHNKKAFEAAKAFNIANAIMNTYLAATKALATYPPPFNFIAAAAAVGMGLAQVATIRSQSYSGRALGGPVMGNQPYIVGENGPELFTPSTTGRVTRNSELTGGGDVNINFNITANDSQGFDDLLVQRRGLITQMISDAMVERGQRSMV